MRSGEVGAQSGLGVVEQRDGRRAGVRGVVAVQPCTYISGIRWVVSVVCEILVVRVRDGVSVVLRTGRHGGGVRLTAYNFRARVGHLRMTSSCTVVATSNPKSRKRAASGHRAVLYTL